VPVQAAWPTLLAILLAALVLGAAVGWGAGSAARRRAAAERLALGERLSAREQELTDLKERLAQTEAALGAAREELAQTQAKLWTAQATLAEREKAQVDDWPRRLSEAMALAATEALHRNSQQFLALARESLGQIQQKAEGEWNQRQQAMEAVVRPLNEQLAQLRQQVAALEQARAGAYAGLHEQVRLLAETGQRLQAETGRLVQALRTPATRGIWGELQLKRVVELAGMQAHVDFDQQVPTSDGSATLRPDLVVHLPGGKQVVVDAKAPLLAYLEAVEAADPAIRQERLRRHAQAVADHIVALSQKAYWAQFPQSPEFVVLFLPGEPLFSAALEQDPTLIEKAAERRVILATPTTLIALLRTVAFGWQQAMAEENARRILDLGQELYRRLLTLAHHLQQLGRHLEATVGDYNRMVGSLESRVLAAARRLKEMGGGEEPPALEPVLQVPRSLQTTSSEADGGA
jgi:DNA recombination protein RmuC